MEVVVLQGHRVGRMGSRLELKGSWCLSLLMSRMPNSLPQRQARLLGIHSIQQQEEVITCTDQSQ